MTRHKAAQKERFACPGLRQNDIGVTAVVHFFPIWSILYDAFSAAWTCFIRQVYSVHPLSQECGKKMGNWKSTERRSWKVQRVWKSHIVVLRDAKLYEHRDNCSQCLVMLFNYKYSRALQTGAWVQRESSWVHRRQRTRTQAQRRWKAIKVVCVFSLNLLKICARLPQRTKSEGAARHVQESCTRASHRVASCQWARDEVVA